MNGASQSNLDLGKLRVETTMSPFISFEVFFFKTKREMTYFWDLLLFRIGQSDIIFSCVLKSSFF